MKATVCLLIFFSCFSILAADDISDTKIAFKNLMYYQKSDDIRSLDLFTKNCLILFKVVDDDSHTNIVVIPTAIFRASLEKEIALKHGNKNEYKDVKYSSDGFSVTVTANIFNSDSGKESPFIAKYGRSIDGVMKIEEIRTTIFKKTKIDKIISP